MSKIKNQHYVPQFYLKSFCDKAEQVWAFDKTNQHIFTSSPRNLASEGYFYDQKQIDEKFGEQHLEHVLGIEETRFSKTFNQLA
ncbi:MULTISPECIES: DUF4238 domain-containing protein [unclassified Pedobacter]|uniref:DUF4238 domain-containing protein n=1 Tax=unclassified Pedobacter TaxID=2628915 RepID=UPI00141FF552|nr:MULTISPECIES: DUF4238 domain-containing protein [unclassified Pedobacter]NII83488.1 hypothetical protein [Pedobacter sp. SG908]NMN37352.1 hypothetical protein [Pedobacter sp. SG918]